MAPFDVHAANRHTPRELLDAGGQLALKRDISSPDEVLKIAGQIAALFGFDLEHWQDMFDFDDLRAAIAGEYVGTDPALNAIQTVVGTIRRFATGIIDPSRLPLIPLAHIGEAAPNLLENGSFDGDDPIEQTEGWTFNPTVGRTKPGSAQTTGNGTRRVLLSNVVLCTPGQQFDVGGFVTWSMLTGGGTGAFKLSAVAYAADDAHVGETVVASINSPSGAQAWTGLLGTYTVPEGAAKIRLQIEVAATVTGGTINWDDLSVTKYGNLPQRMVAGLVAALGDLGAGIAATIENVGNFFDKLTGKIGTTIADLQSWAGQLKTILSGGTVGSGIFPTLDDGLRAAVSGVQGFAQSILEKIVQAIRGIPVVGAGLADLFDDVTALRSTADTANATAITADTKAVTAQASATAAQAQANGVSAATLALMQTATDEWKLTKQEWTPGTYTWNVDKTPTPGYELIGYDLITVAGGDSGGVPGLRTEGARGGLGGGYRRKRIPIADMPNSATVVVGTGAAAKSGTGRGNTGNPTRFTGLCESPKAGQSVIDTIFGDIPCADRPGRGGDGGGIITDTDNGSTTYRAGNGQDGENSLEAAGGSMGTSGEGWFGGSPTAPTAGGSPTQPADDIRCGAGGAGAGARTGTATPVAGAAGGDPGGGGGASGGWSNNFFGPAASGPGGPGRAAAIKVERKLT